MSYYPYGGFTSIMFHVIPFFMILIFIMMISIILYHCIAGLSQKKKNDESPVLTVDAVLVAKREDVRTHHRQNMMTNLPDTTSSTTYYLTFEVASGDRMEFKVSGIEYGMMAQRDQGRLTFQGKRYLSFERDF